MIRVADLLSSAFDALAAQPPAPAGAPLSSWFDDTPAPTLCIGASPGDAWRGLSVAQHAQRVLGHLCSMPEER